MPKSSNLTGPLPRRLAGGLALVRSQRNIEATIYSAFREAILSGELPPRTRLMPHRKMAQLLGVARSTVQLAFDRLVSDGYVEAASGRGTFVSTLADVSRPNRASRAGAPSATIASRGGEPVSLRAFRVGIPALDHFPRDRWMRATRRVIAESPMQLFDKGDPQGYGPLREAILAHVRRTRGIRGETHNVFIVAGAQAAMTLIARTIVCAGDAVCVEDPGYLPLRDALGAAHARLVPCLVDDDGMDVNLARKRCRAPRAVAVTASHHVPLGVQMSIGRRSALLQWVRATSGYVIEDDYDSEFRFSGSPLPALQSIDTAGRVVYVGTFSKTLFPSLRLAYIVAPDGLIDDLLRIARQTGSMAPAMDQAALAQFMSDGDFARHVRRMTRLYADRRERLLAALARRFDETELHLRRQSTVGLHVAAEIPKGVPIRDSEIARLMKDEGVALGAFSTYAIHARVNGLIFGFGAASAESIEPSIEKLRSMWNRLQER